MDELIHKIDNIIADLKKNEIKKESDMWYFLKNLEEYKQRLKSVENKDDFYKSNYLFNYFCNDCLDWDSLEYSAYIALSDKAKEVYKNFS